MRFRVIYLIEVYRDAETADDMVVARRFAANKRTADRIARKYKDVSVSVRKLHKNERAWVSPLDVERL